MALGLAWTSMGGDVLIIEAAAVKGKGGYKLTGQMGDVMKESANIAYTRARKMLENIEGSTRFFDQHIVHLHIPEGATPKDGPSAGNHHDNSPPFTGLRAQNPFQTRP